MTPERIAELLRLCEAATSGPWEHEPDRSRRNEPPVINMPNYELVRMGEWRHTFDYVKPADAAFIAAARTALPEALDQLIDLQAGFTVTQWMAMIEERDAQDAALRAQLTAVTQLCDDVRALNDANVEDTKRIAELEGENERLRETAARCVETSFVANSQLKEMYRSSALLVDGVAAVNVPISDWEQLHEELGRHRAAVGPAGGLPTLVEHHHEAIGRIVTQRQTIAELQAENERLVARMDRMMAGQRSWREALRALPNDAPRLLLAEACWNSPGGCWCGYHISEVQDLASPAPQAKCWHPSGDCINHGACNAHGGCSFRPAPEEKP